MNHTLVDVFVVAVSAACVTALTMLGVPQPKPKPEAPAQQVESGDPSVKRAAPLNQNQQQQIVIDLLEDKLEEAEDDLDAIAKLLVERKELQRKHEERDARKRGVEP